MPFCWDDGRMAPDVVRLIRRNINIRICICQARANKKNGGEKARGVAWNSNSELHRPKSLQYPCQPVYSVRNSEFGEFPAGAFPDLRRASSARSWAMAVDVKAYEVKRY